MQRLKSCITAVKEGGREGERGKGGRGKIGRERWGKEGGSSICERNLKCTQYDARHCLTHIFTEVSIDCQL